MDHNRRIRGSLLERAAQAYDFGRPPVVQPKPAPAPVPAPAAVEVEAPKPIAQPAPAPAPVPVAAPAPVAVPIAAPTPRPVPVSAPPPVEAKPAPVVEQPAPAPVAERAPLIRRGSEVAAAAAAPASPSPADKWKLRTVHVDRAKLVEQGLLVPGAAVDTLAEEFRMVKRQLLLTARAVAGADSDRARMILVASANPNEGKTFCAINLALSMAAEQDVEILLVDADFAKPDVLGRMGVAEGKGLLDALADPALDVESCVVRTDIPRLSLLPAGTKSALDTELIASDRAKQALQRLVAADPRRVVIFDSPPVLAASPASVLALHVGQAVMIVRADRTTESDLRQAIGLLDGCEHVQLVLNSVTYNPGGRRFGSYYGQESSK